MNEFPTAFFLTPLEDVRVNPYVLFRLVKPTPPNRLQKSGGVESAAGLVNVIPQRRIYRMETVEEIEIFKRELLKRPLVLQSVSHSGMGCGNGTFGCGFFTNDRNWVLLINQTHPKVLGRLQMGCDAAQHAMNRGDPFVLRFRFGTLLQRLHSELFRDDIILYPSAQYTEWEYAQVIVRFPGKRQMPTNNPAAAFTGPVCRELNFDFDDIMVHEIKHVTNNHTMVLRGPIPAITQDEIRELLPEWTVNDLTPLEEMGEERPETYSYQQAGRLYESFRKKKRQRQKSGDEPEPRRPNSGMPRRGLNAPPPEDTIEMDDINIDDDGGFGEEARQYVPTASRAPVKPERRNRKSYASETDPRGAGSGLYPDVMVVDNRDRAPSSDSANWNRPDYRGQDSSVLDQGPHRDSDRSSNSAGESTATAADSGYSGDDGYGGYYGRRQETGYGGYNQDLDQKYGNTTRQRAHENLGFRDNDHRKDDILVKHQEYVSNKLSNGERRDYRSPRSDYQYGDRYDSRGDNYGPPGRGDNYRPPPGRGDNYGPSPGRDNHYGRSPVRGDNYGPPPERGDNYERSPGRGDYYDMNRSRDYNDYDSAAPPSYIDVASSPRSKFQIQDREAMAESFI